MPRMKLPKPAERRARMIAYIARHNLPSTDDAVAAKFYRAGYDHARRDANHSNHVEGLKAQRRRWNMSDHFRRMRELEMNDPAVCKCRTCKTNRGETN